MHRLSICVNNNYIDIVLSVFQVQSLINRKVKNLDNTAVLCHCYNGIIQVIANCEVEYSTTLTSLSQLLNFSKF